MKKIKTPDFNLYDILEAISNKYPNNPSARLLTKQVRTILEKAETIYENKASNGTLFHIHSHKKGIYSKQNGGKLPPEKMKNIHRYPITFPEFDKKENPCYLFLYLFTTRRKEKTWILKNIIWWCWAKFSSRFRQN